MRIFAFILLASTVVCSIGAKASMADCGTCDKSVVEVAVESKDFGTLVAAVKAADLVKVLSGKGPFTVFAPTDKAFAQDSWSCSRHRSGCFHRRRSPGSLDPICRCRRNPIRIPTDQSCT